jgi:glycine cleavage system transcriptional repressor
VSEAFVEFGANIVRLNSERVRGGRKTLYVTNFDVAIPGDRAQVCLAAVANTAAQLQLECTWEVV